MGICLDVVWLFSFLKGNRVVDGKDESATFILSAVASNDGVVGDGFNFRFAS